MNLQQSDFLTLLEYRLGSRDPLLCCDQDDWLGENGRKAVTSEVSEGGGTSQIRAAYQIQVLATGGDALANSKEEKSHAVTKWLGGKDFTELAERTDLMPK